MLLNHILLTISEYTGKVCTVSHNVSTPDRDTLLFTIISSTQQLPSQPYDHVALWTIKFTTNRTPSIAIVTFQSVSLFMLQPYLKSLVALSLRNNPLTPPLEFEV